MTLFSLTLFLIGLAAFLIFGPKIKTGKSYVRLKDQKIEGNDKSKRSQTELLTVLAGSLGGAGAGYAITGSYLFTMIGLAGGYFALRYLHKKRESDRMELLNEQYPKILGHFESSIRSSYTPYQTIEDGLTSFPRPAKDIFTEILNRERNGKPLAEALYEVMQETRWKQLRTLYVALKLWKSKGIKINKICEYELAAYYDSENQRGQVAGAIAQNMAALNLLSGMPFMIIGFFRAVAPGFTTPLFHTTVGIIFFTFCTSMIIFGNMIIRKKIKDTLEGR